MKRNKRKPCKGHSGVQLTLMFSGVVFFIMAAATLLVLIGNFFLYKLGFGHHEFLKFPLFLFTGACVVVGTIIAAIINRVPLKPIREIISATDKLAAGDFSARIDLRGPNEFKLLSRSFNHMAEELGGVELLRNDFVNNFSHEFKTPIVSVSGFAKMLKRPELTDEERSEYLDIIISESDRLTQLATNVLNLSKLENQSILTGKKHFNVTEQIRRIVAMLDSKWSEKRIEITFDCDEVYLDGNEELLGQAWINLIDNAIKFSPENAVVDIGIRRDRESVVFTISDEGVGIPEDIAARIFDKFYQGDTSHATKGNGLGLTISKRIVGLHGGEIRSVQGGGGAVFEVKIPV